MKRYSIYLIIMALTLSHCHTQKPPSMSAHSKQHSKDLQTSRILITSHQPPSHFSKGIYLQQSIFENKHRFNTLIQKAQQYHIDAFVVDLHRMTSRTAQHIQRMHAHHLKYIARVVVFPHGGTDAQVNNPVFWQKYWPTISSALSAGADEIQLDYIRYRSDSPPNPNKIDKILKVVKWYKTKLHAHNTPIQAAVFGITAFHPALRIGQDMNEFIKVVDVVCPMLYPSHWEPQAQYGRAPYRTVLNAIQKIKQNQPPKHSTRIIPYIEMSNYQIHHTRNETKHYILRQIQAAQDSGSDGWYAWSASNYYQLLFEVLDTMQQTGHLKHA